VSASSMCICADMPRLPQPCAVFVDEDGVLFSRGQINPHVVAWFKACKREGFGVVIWSSSRGRAHAQRAVRLASMEGMPDAVDATQPN